MSGTEREWVAEESVVVATDAGRVYDLVADVGRTGEWSPECFKVLVRGGRGGLGDRGGRGGLGRGPVPAGTRFVGFNRIGPRVWFTNGLVTVARPGDVFAYRVSSFGIPVALWGFRIEDIGTGETRLTQYWEDLRRDGGIGVRFVTLLGKVFTGVAGELRAEHNRAGMRASLERMKTLLEGSSAGR